MGREGSKLSYHIVEPLAGQSGRDGKALRRRSMTPRAIANWQFIRQKRRGGDEGNRKDSKFGTDGVHDPRSRA
jgi:hypothetical protein